MWFRASWITPHLSSGGSQMRKRRSQNQRVRVRGEVVKVGFTEELSTLRLEFSVYSSVSCQLCLHSWTNKRQSEVWSSGTGCFSQLCSPWFVKSFTNSVCLCVSPVRMNTTPVTPLTSMKKIGLSGLSIKQSKIPLNPMKLVNVRMLNSPTYSSLCWKHTTRNCSDNPYFTFNWRTTWHFAPSGSSEEADEGRRGAGGGAAWEGGTGLVVQILRLTGGDGETGETLWDWDQTVCLNKYGWHSINVEYNACRVPVTSRSLCKTQPMNV